MPASPTIFAASNSGEAGAPDSIPAELIEEITLRLLRFTRDDLEDEYARNLIRLVLRYYRLI
jgi:hypothetical protein